MFEKKRKYPSNGFRICVDGRENDIRGKVFSPLEERTITFSGFNELMLAMDEIFDKNGYPQAFQEKRTFADKKGSAPYHGVPEVSPEAALIYEKEGTLFTVDVIVESRRNTSWQGYVYLTDNTKLGEFQGEIELLQILLQYQKTNEIL